jgi:hypothetical protein
LTVTPCEVRDGERTSYEEEGSINSQLALRVMLLHSRLQLISEPK